MRIPAEIIPPVANVNRELDGERKAEPVESLAALPDDLSGSPDNEPRPSREPREHQAASYQHQENRQPAVERRQADRRSQNRPILIDTRLSRGRRRASGEGSLSIKV